MLLDSELSTDEIGNDIDGIGDIYTVGEPTYSVYILTDNQGAPLGGSIRLYQDGGSYKDRNPHADDDIKDRSTHYKTHTEVNKNGGEISDVNWQVSVEFLVNKSKVEIHPSYEPYFSFLGPAGSYLRTSTL